MIEKTVEFIADAVLYGAVGLSVLCVIGMVNRYVFGRRSGPQKTYYVSGGYRIKCLKCGTTSYNPNDIREKYCGNCNSFHELMGFDRGGR